MREVRPGNKRPSFGSICTHNRQLFMHFYIILKPTHACIVSLSLKLRFSLDFFEQPNLYCSLHFFFVRISFSSSKTPIPKFSRAKKFFSRAKNFWVRHDQHQKITKNFWSEKSKIKRNRKFLRHPQTVPGRAFNFLSAVLNF